jgi:hypothetical protein
MREYLGTAKGIKMSSQRIRTHRASERERREMCRNRPKKTHKTKTSGLNVCIYIFFELEINSKEQHKKSPQRLRAREAATHINWESL